MRWVLPLGKTSSLRLKNANALLHLLPRRLAAEHRAHTLLQRLDVRLKEPGLELRQERVHSEEGVGLVGGEPKARQFVARAGPGMTELVAIRFAVVLDRGVEAVAHVLEVPLDACPRNLKALHQCPE